MIAAHYLADEFQESCHLCMQTIESSDDTGDMERFHEWMTFSSVTPQNSYQSAFDSSDSELIRPLLSGTPTKVDNVKDHAIQDSNNGECATMPLPITAQHGQDNETVSMEQGIADFERFVGTWKKDFEASDMDGMEKLMVMIGMCM